MNNPVEIPEYVVPSDELHGDGGVVSTPVHEIAPELEGVGPVRASSVDEGDLEWSRPALPTPSWRGRLGRTFAAAGLGMPYMLGLRRRREASAQ